MEARNDIAEHGRRWLVLAVLCLSVLLVVVVVDNTIVNVALPTISRELHASTSALQWVVDGYTLSFAGLLPLGGNLGDRLGRRRFLQLGLLLFGVFSVGAALSRGTGELIAARALMGAPCWWPWPSCRRAPPPRGTPRLPGRNRRIPVPPLPFAAPDRRPGTPPGRAGYYQR